jgi:hypothetical protein
MLDKLEKHNNKKYTYVFNRRINLIKETILSFFGYKKVEEKTYFYGNYSLSTKK